MKFEKDGSKLALIAENDKEAEWISTLKQSARRVKPGSEKFVLQAYKAWCGGASSPAAEKASAAFDRAAYAAGEWQRAMACDDQEARRHAGSEMIKAINEYCQLKGINLPWNDSDDRIGRETACYDFVASK